MVRADRRQLLPGAEHHLWAWASSRSKNGRAEEGEKWLREALPVALQIGGWVVLNTYWHLVESLVAQDRLDDAREIVAFAARGVPEEDPHSRAWLSLTEAWVATAAGESAAAAAAFAEAVRLFEELDYALDLAEARFAFARSLLAFGEVVGAPDRARARALDLRPHRRGRPPRRRGRGASGAGRGAGSRRPLDCIVRCRSLLLPDEPTRHADARHVAGSWRRRLDYCVGAGGDVPAARCDAGMFVATATGTGSQPNNGDVTRGRAAPSQARQPVRGRARK